MRRKLLIALPACAFAAGVAAYSTVQARNSRPLGPLQPFAVREETTFRPARFSVDSPSLQVNIWLEGRDVQSQFAAYRKWLHDDLSWTILPSGGAAVNAAKGVGIIPQATITIEHKRGGEYLMTYDRQLSRVEALIDARLYKSVG